MIGIIDYGLGNVHAFANIYERLNIPVMLAKTETDLEKVSHIILPGVGSFDWAMKCLIKSGMRDKLDYLVIESKLPVLGVCVGMQIMAKKSDEGLAKGLGWVNANVLSFKADNIQSATKCPHLGWNNVLPKVKSNLFHKLDKNSSFYFLHSYYLFPENPNDIIAQTNYGGLFTSAVSNQNIYGVQFHPEKSHDWGVQLLKNFAGL